MQQATVILEEKPLTKISPDMACRLDLFQEAASHFFLQKRFVVNIGDNDDLDTEDEKLALERAMELTRLGIPLKAVRVKPYWLVSQGQEDDYLIAQHYGCEKDAVDAMERVHQRWMRRQMEGLM